MSMPSRNPAGDSRTLLNICEATRLICVPNSAPESRVDGGKTLPREPAFRSIVAPSSRVSEAMSLKTSAHVGPVEPQGRKKERGKRDEGQEREEALRFAEEILASDRKDLRSVL